jgi:hypothetical protein
MSQKRFLAVALAGLIVIGLLIAGGAAIRRSAWTQGYMMGRLTAGADDGAAVPYGVYGFDYPRSHSGFVSFLCTAGLFVLLLIAVGKFFRFHAWKMAHWGHKPPEGDWPKGERWARHWHWHHRPPWWGWKEPAEEEAGEAESGAETGEAAAEA